MKNALKVLGLSFFSCLLLLLSFTFFQIENKAHASTPAYTLNAAAKTSATNGEIVPLTIKMDTGGNDIVVSRVVIRYNKRLVNVSVSDVDLTGSVFATGNTCTFPSDYSDTALRNKPCQIISNDSAYGILSITLAMPSHNAPTNPGAQINSADALVATVNFHAIANINTSTEDGLMKAIGGIYYVNNRSYYLDTDMIKDDGLGTDVLASVPIIRSTVSNGDLNSDHSVNGGDFSIMHANYNNTTPVNAADINGDGTVNGADFSVLHANYNKTF